MPFVTSSFLLLVDLMVQNVNLWIAVVVLLTLSCSSHTLVITGILS